MSVSGLITIESAQGPKETIDQLLAGIASRSLAVFARIDHAAGAAEVGLPLRPTELVIFGNAKGGTPLMQRAQTIGIDLPLKALVWQDADKRTWLSYDDPAWIVERHGVDPHLLPNLKVMTEMLASLAREAAAPA